MHSLSERLRKISAGYGGQQPLSGYLAALGTYTGLLGGVVAAALVTGRRAPERVSPADALMLAVATHKIARLVTKDAVTSPLRAPFTSFAGPAGDGEVNEDVVAAGPAHAVGELLTCPFCLAVWVATGLCTGLVFAPRTTRLVTAGFTAVAGADFLHLAYDAAKKASGNTGRDR
jgi:hypothetical protein